MKWYKDLKNIGLILLSVLLIGAIGIVSKEVTESSKLNNKLKILSSENAVLQVNIESKVTNIKKLESQVKQLKKEGKKYKKDLIEEKETSQKYELKYKEQEEYYAEFANRESAYQSEIETLNSELSAEVQKTGYLQVNYDSVTAELEQYRQTESKSSTYGSGRGAGSGGGTFAGGAAQSEYDDNVTETVHITNTGNKYHSSGCQYLQKSDITISLSDAKSQGYTACSKCY